MKSRHVKLPSAPAAERLSPAEIELLREDSRLALETYRVLRRIKDATARGAPAVEVGLLQGELESLKSKADWVNIRFLSAFWLGFSQVPQPEERAREDSNHQPSDP
jgi:hypothetical protein